MHGNIATNVNSRLQMHEPSDAAVMINGAPSIENGMFSYDRVGLHNRAGAHHGPSSRITLESIQDEG
jgi:hypothetical protein